MKNSQFISPVVLTCAAFLVSIAAFAGDDVDKTLAVPSNGLVKIVNTRGEIEIIGWDKDEIHVAGELDDLAEELVFEVMADPMNKGYYLEAALASAYAYKKTGDHEKMERALADIESKLAQKQESGRIDSEIWHMQALLATIKDDRQMTFIHLQRAVDEGWRQHWRPGFEPIFKDLVNEKSFQSMMAGLETRMDIMRDQLALAAAFDSDWAG
ncbi:MAG: hypothetical protein CMQ19_01010 [Gammaproteobacteria bacterium]|nr:hypothetical protein [Gammaproteobacteria bacterium]|tara:strand:+ start:517 stop:1152 length:636 start_codon:yes stop_codon:yes gene_type:complete